MYFVLSNDEFKDADVYNVLVAFKSINYTLAWTPKNPLKSFREVQGYEFNHHLNFSIKKANPVHLINFFRKSREWIMNGISKKHSDR